MTATTERPADKAADQSAGRSAKQHGGRHESGRPAAIAAWALGSVFGLLAVAVFGVAVWTETDGGALSRLPTLFVVSAFLGVGAVAAPLAALHGHRSRVRHQRIAERDFALLDAACRQGPDPAVGLRLSFTFRLLDRFVCLALEQARAAYIFCAVSASVSLLVLIGGATAAVASGPHAAQVAIAIVTGVGTALSGYLSVTFMRTYERARQQMNCYYSQPMGYGFLLQAEWLALRKNLPADLQAVLIEHTLARGQEAQDHLFNLIGAKD